MTNTMMVVMVVSRRVGQVTLAVSERTSCMNLNGLKAIFGVSASRPEDDYCLRKTEQPSCAQPSFRKDEPASGLDGSGGFKGRAGYPHLGGPAAGGGYVLWKLQKVKVPHAGSGPCAPEYQRLNGKRAAAVQCGRGDRPVHLPGAPRAVMLAPINRKYRERTMNIARRLAGVAALGLGAALLQPASAEPPAPALKIGLIGDFQSVYSDIGGMGNVEATRMAIEEFGGTMFGKPIELITADVQNKADIAGALARKWYENEAVDMII